jgi:hypothetical protein
MDILEPIKTEDLDFLRKIKNLHHQLVGIN